jgi:hypothetical protein
MLIKFVIVFNGFIIVEESPFSGGSPYQDLGIKESKLLTGMVPN